MKLMNTEDLEGFQEMLERMRAETLQSLGRATQEGRSLGEASGGDMGECSTNNLSRELAFQQSTRKRQALRNIEAALQRIREGTFGGCMSCGGNIQIARLRAMPFSAYCRDCQEQFEREQSSRPSLAEASSVQRKRPSRSVAEKDSSSDSDIA
jgi:DnaK suppressor protein